MNPFNEYKPTVEEPVEFRVGLSGIAVIIAVCAIMLGALKLAFWLDYCNIMGM